ncbi:hypothetical protein DFQ29_007048 [Apophysomyces sp. BC1021]|nr:hypothetical protein DFQ29_007048 [Apophysomyces sp. BC1021]
MRALKKSVPRLSRKEAKAIAFEYAYERVAGGEPAWPIEIVDLVSTDTWTEVNSICDQLSAVIPAPATSESMSASPGAYIPALQYILQKYDEEYQDEEHQDEEH